MKFFLESEDLHLIEKKKPDDADRLLLKMKERILKSTPHFDFDFHNKVTLFGSACGMLSKLIQRDNLLQLALSNLISSLSDIKHWEKIRPWRKMLDYDCAV